jgi:hypothetical protein
MLSALFCYGGDLGQDVLLFPKLTPALSVACALIGLAMDIYHL